MRKLRALRGHIMRQNSASQCIADTALRSYTEVIGILGPRRRLVCLGQYNYDDLMIDGFAFREREAGCSPHDASFT
jgi:hypothetical protein